jgi:hypothetical protein
VLVFILTVGLGIAVAILFNRVAQLQSRVDWIERAAEPARPRAPRSERMSARVVAAPRPVTADYKSETPAAQVIAPEPALEPAPELAPEPVPEPIANVPDTSADAPLAPAFQSRLTFEELFGSKLPIWAGGITLAVAGLFIVKYSIDNGLLSPPVRVVLGLMFAAALVFGAELTRSWSATRDDPRVSQALAGAGIASAYAAILMATNVYALIGPVTGFLGLASVTAGALGLALRFGAPSAVLGLVGGLSAPALVGAAPGSVTQLSLYLMITILGLAGVARAQGWRWLSVAALAGGFGWGVIMLAMDVAGGFANTALGSYMLLLGFGVPFVAGGEDRRGLMRLIPVTGAAAQIALLVATGGYTPFVWAFYGLLSVGTIFLARIDARQAQLPLIALAIAFITVVIWPQPDVVSLTGVLSGFMLLFGGIALVDMWTARGSAQCAIQAAGAALGGVTLGVFKTPVYNADLGALVAVIIAVPIAAVAWRGWANSHHRADIRFAILVATAAILVSAATILALPLWSVPQLLMTIAATTAVIARYSGNDPLAGFARVAAGGAVLSIALDFAAAAEVGRLLGDDHATDVGQAVWRWAGTALAAAPFARFDRAPESRSAAQIAVGALAAVAVAQCVPLAYVAVACAVGALATAQLGRRLNADVMPMIATLGAMTLAWTLLPLGQWALATLQTLAGIPLYVSRLPTPDIAILRLIIPGVLLAWVAFGELRVPHRKSMAIALSVLPVVGLFILAKHVVAIDSADVFEGYGLVERVVFTTMLYAVGSLAWRRAAANPVLRAVAMGLTAVALGRTLLFDVVLFNPVLRDQAVGVLPLLNWLAPAFLLPLGWIAMAGKRDPAIRARFNSPVIAVQMTLVLIFAFATVRQLFHGNILPVGTVSPTEDIARSLVAVALAIGFLRWGIANGERIWRIASLVLILGAVAKVFLFDAAGLDGLLRIASFVALGFSLIGIGWLYTRYLKADLALTEN